MVAYLLLIVYKWPVVVWALFIYFTAGDGGNDVSMIQAANVGIGIVGKVISKCKCVCSSVVIVSLSAVIFSQEGKQASLAADFSITQFRHVSRLLVWHGRNRYSFCMKGASNLAQNQICRSNLVHSIVTYNCLSLLCNA